MLGLKNYFVHGPTVRYVHLPEVKVDTDLLQDGARKEAGQNKPSGWNLESTFCLKELVFSSGFPETEEDTG
jgi:hypothetical protein